jgi:hypothetical protein
LLRLNRQQQLGDLPVGTYTNDYGTELTASITGVETLGGTQYVSTGWALTGGTDAGGNAAGVETNVTLTLTNDVTLTWVWQTQYQLTLLTNGSGSVTPASGTYFDAGSNVTVTATDEPYWSFAAWSGDTNDCVQVANVLSADMTQARSITAEFAPNIVTNGTPQWWLASYGLTNLDWNALAMADPDGDGVPTWQEYQADTNPTNMQSYLGFTSILFTNGLLRLDWQGGDLATQTLQIRSSLTDSETVWTPLFTNTPPTGITNSEDFGLPTSPAFFRIRAER